MPDAGSITQRSHLEPGKHRWELAPSDFTEISVMPQPQEQQTAPRGEERLSQEGTKDQQGRLGSGALASSPASGTAPEAQIRSGGPDPLWKRQTSLVTGWGTSY